MDTSEGNDTNERLFALTDPDPDPVDDGGEQGAAASARLEPLTGLQQNVPCSGGNFIC